MSERKYKCQHQIKRAENQRGQAPIDFMGSTEDMMGWHCDLFIASAYLCPYRFASDIKQTSSSIFR